MNTVSDEYHGCDGYCILKLMKCKSPDCRRCNVPIIAAIKEVLKK